MASSRNLTLTEELEKLEQSITLTLQEIDHNFSRAHRIVTSSILPIVQQYAAHSEAVWSGSKFWKEFFEASANISLTGYEEAEEDETGAYDEDGEETGDVTQTQTTHGGGGEQDAIVATEESATPQRPHSRAEEEEDNSSLLNSPSVSVAAAVAHGSTPRARGKAPARNVSGRQPARQDDEITSSFADYPSPYEALRQDTTGATSRIAPNAVAPSTPNAPGTSATTPRTRPSPFTQPKNQKQQPPTQNANPNNDPLLHRILDKNYRIAATPHTTRRASPQKPKATQQTQIQIQNQTRDDIRKKSLLDLDSSPFSPAMQAPALRAEIFGDPSPIRPSRSKSAPYGKAAKENGHGQNRFGFTAGQRGGGPNTPRTPGVSVQRPRSLYGVNGNANAQVRSGFTPGTVRGTEAPDTTRKTLFTDTMTSQAQPRQTQAQSNNAQSQLTQPISRAAPAGLSWDSSDSEDGLHDETANYFGGMSPPKTVQLNLPSKSGRVVQTPAREASRKIVGDLLRDAGGEDGDESSEWVASAGDGRAGE